MNTFLYLIALHCVCDYPLQGDFLARGKNHQAPLPGVPWWICLGAHAFIHAGAVAFVTQNWTIGLLEFVTHICIDAAKCEGLLGEGSSAFTIDQVLHVVCKICWVALA